ncbi:MAG TPA: protein kinase [Gammaproteobacteria bacterium]
MSGWAYRGELPERADDAPARPGVPPAGAGAERPAGGPGGGDGDRPMGALGSVIANRYVLASYLGNGRYGEVYKALDRALSDPQFHQEHFVALHLLHDGIAQQTHLLQRLESAYQQPHSWSHPNVVKVRGFGSDRGRYFLAMELLEGATLRSIIDATPGELLPEAEIFAVLRAVGDALQFAHAKGVVHGDVRPEKIFITHEYAIKVLDLLPASVPRTVPFFVEDEAPNGLASPDPRDDVYGLACVAYELFAGRHPFNANSPLEALNAGLGLAPIPGSAPERWHALARALALRREERTGSVAAFLRDLGVKGHETLRPPSEASESPAPAEAPRSQTPAQTEAPGGEPAAPRHERDDDVPVLLDAAPAAVSAPARPAAAPPPPSPPPRPAAAPPPPPPRRAQAAFVPVEPDWPRYERDFELYADVDSRLERRAPRRAPWRVVVLALAAAAAGVAVYAYYEPLRGLAVEWYAMAHVFAEDLLGTVHSRVQAARDDRQAAGSVSGEAAVEAPVIAEAPSAAETPAPATAGEAPERQAPAAERLAPPEEGQAPVAERRAPAQASQVPAATAEEGSHGVRPGPAATPTSVPPFQETAQGGPGPAAPAASEPAALELPSAPITVAEDDAVAAVVVRRGGGALDAVEIVWWTSDGSAVADEDYANLGARTETFAAGQETLALHVPIVVDARPEGTESFYVNVRFADTAHARSAAQRVEVRIVDDD